MDGPLGHGPRSTAPTHALRACMPPGGEGVLPTPCGYCPALKARSLTNVLEAIVPFQGCSTWLGRDEISQVAPRPNEERVLGRTEMVAIPYSVGGISAAWLRAAVGPKDAGAFASLTSITAERLGESAAMVTDIHRLIRFGYAPRRDAEACHPGRETARVQSSKSGRSPLVGPSPIAGRRYSIARSPRRSACAFRKPTWPSSIRKPTGSCS